MKPKTISRKEVARLNLYRGVPTEAYLRTEVDEALIAGEDVFKNGEEDSDSAFKNLSKNDLISTTNAEFIHEGNENWLGKYI